MVRTVCYKREREWASRDDAIKFFDECCRNSCGHERDRYINILWKLRSGDDVCTDCDWYSVIRDGKRSFDNWDEAVRYANGAKILEAW
jgi:hypothetical protein